MTKTNLYMGGIALAAILLVNYVPALQNLTNGKAT